VAGYGAVDVHYPESGGARAALVVARDEHFADLVEERVSWLDTVTPYQPGSFYTRELPALRSVLATTGPLDLLIVDGYVDLDPDGRPGLGAHLHDLGLVPVVVGVAKTPFRAATHAVPVLRGQSTRPLYVTAAGMAPPAAADLVRRMSGTARIPDALRRVDRLARGASAAGAPRG
jgi:deoxyribonuclease V